MSGTLQQLGIEGLNPGACWGAGEWSVSAGRATLESEDPACGECLARVATANADDYRRVLDSAVAAFGRWRQVPAPERGALVRLLAERLRQHQDWLGTLISRETGKIKQEGDGEVQEAIDIADFAVGLSRMLYGRTMPSERPQHRLYEQWHPLGVVGVITAFNFPLAVWAWNAMIAAVAGDTLVWRPSPQAPLTALAVQHLCNQVMRETCHGGVFNLLIEPDPKLAKRLVADPALPLISFTGSSEVGRRVGAQVAARLGRSLLELSGNNAVIVEASADLDLVVPAVLFGAVGTAGQRCTSTRRLLVQRGREAELVARLREAYAQVRVGDPLDPRVLMGPLISREAVACFAGAIETLREAGGEILYGGETLAGPGHFVQPTLARADNDWPLVQRETFGPLLYLLPYDTLEQAIAMQNAVPQGLSSALFTSNLSQVERFLCATGSDCGIANINIGTSGAEIGGAFGGEKATGGGREAGSDAWKAYMRRQTNTINWGSGLPLAQGIHFTVEGLG